MCVHLHPFAANPNAAGESKMLQRIVLISAVAGILAGITGCFAASDASQARSVNKSDQPVAGGDWPLFRGNSLATAVATSSLPSQPELLWTYTPEKTAFAATPLVVNGFVYVGDLDGGFHAIDLVTGKEKWKTKQNAGYNAAAAYRDGRVYVGDVDGVFHCLDASSGDENWHFETQAQIDSAPNFYKANVLFGSQDGTLYALDALSGKELWKYQIDDQIRCSPTIVEGRAFLAGCDGKLHIIDVEKGDATGAVPIESPTGSTPAALGSMVYFGTEAGTFFGIDWKSQEIKWQYQDKARSLAIRSSAAATPAAVIFGGRDKVLRAMDPRTGDEVWKFTARRAIDSSAVVAGDRVFFASTDGRLYGLGLKSGEMQWEYEAGGGFTGSPAVATGRLVIASDDGHVYCFGAK
jgi:outer membrane protein assembly factor BamB